MKRNEHDPLCDWWMDQCGDYCNDNLSYDDFCEHMWCTCFLIAKVRADQVGRDVDKVKAAYSETHVDDWGVQVLYLRSAIDALRGDS